VASEGIDSDAAGLDSDGDAFDNVLGKGGGD
jgi:hypothetical protein